LALSVERTSRPLPGSNISLLFRILVNNRSPIAEYWQAEVHGGTSAATTRGRSDMAGETHVGLGSDYYGVIIPRGHPARPPGLLLLDSLAQGNSAYTAQARQLWRKRFTCALSVTQM
jgi:hypothetical protein